MLNSKVCQMIRHTHTQYILIRFLLCHRFLDTCVWNRDAILEKENDSELVCIETQLADK